MLQILTLAMAGFLLIFLVVVLVLVESGGAMLPALNSYYSTLVAGLVIFAFACIMAGKKILSRAAVNAKNSINPLEGKLNGYRTAFVIYLALMEAPALISLLAYLFTGGFPFLALAAVLLGLLIAGRPTVAGMVTTLDLDAVEAEQLRKPGAPV